MDTSDHTSSVKSCKRCGTPCPRTSEYYQPAKSCKDGLRLVCRKCMSKADRENYAEKRESRLAQVREYRASNIELIRAYDRARYVSNPVRRKRTDKQRERSRRYKREHPDWDKSTPVQKCAKSARRRARKRAAQGTFTAADIQQIRLAQTDKHGELHCWYCGEVLTAPHIEHKVPLSRGGSNAPENLCLACEPCNKSKGSKLPQEWNGRLF